MLPWAALRLVLFRAAEADQTLVVALRPLADEGNAVAQLNLGFMYNLGRGVPEDLATAVSWYRKAAEQGHAQGQYNLGVMYNNGRGVTQDFAAAAAWYRKAADQGEVHAQFKLGLQAHKWFNLASVRYDAAEKENRESAAKERDAVAAKMTPAQIAEAQKLRQEWKPMPEAGRP